MNRQMHTPGPWVALPNEFCMVAGNGWKVCLLPEAISPEHEANARLIAAAPELLAALKAIAEEVPMLWGDQVRDGRIVLVLPEGHLDSLFMAIAKAEGRE